MSDGLPDPLKRRLCPLTKQSEHGDKCLWNGNLRVPIREFSACGQQAFEFAAWLLRSFKVIQVYRRKRPVDQALSRVSILAGDLSNQWIFGLGQGWGFFRQGFVGDLDQCLKLHLAMMVEASPGRDDVTHDHIFLK